MPWPQLCFYTLQRGFIYKQIIKNNISVTGINFPHIQVEWLNFDKTAVFNNGIDIKIVNKNKVNEVV